MKIIMISMDTMRADRLGCYGYDRPTSPFLDSIAKDGVLFENAYAADIPTEVAHTDIFTGKLGLTTGVVAHGSNLSFLPKTTDWLPTIFKKFGVLTGAVDNMYQLQEWFARGYRHYINSSGKQRWIDGRAVNDLAIPWIRSHKSEDFFLFLHYWDPHTPYLPPKDLVSLFYDSDKNPYELSNNGMQAAYNHVAYPFFKHHHYEMLGPVTDPTYVNALYDAEVRYMDSLLEELNQCLLSEGIHDDTLLVVFGDHGESLTEHGIYWDHCGLYEQSVHVPMMMRWPGHIAPGRRVKGLVQQVDMMPTMLEAFGIEAPDHLDGRTLWPSIDAREDGTHAVLYLSECAWQAARAVRTSQFKFIRTADSGPFTRPPKELYDLSQDPAEEHNIADLQPNVVRTLEAQLDGWISQTLGEREDPVDIVLREQGLPFRRRIEQILREQVDLTWEEWLSNPDRTRFDTLYAMRHA